MTPELFIGLVTHRRSRFSDAVTADGLQSRVAAAIAAAGTPVQTGISDRDEYTPELLPISADVVRASIDAELSSESRWRAYVSGKPADLAVRMLMSVRRATRTLSLAPPWKRELGPEDDGPRMVRRLVNIELSHLRVIDEAVASGARWSLLLEDDAASSDPEAFATALLQFMRDADQRDQPLTLNMSESFTIDDLGIGHLLTPVPQSRPWPMFAAERPVTNTVCAVLYRGDFLARLRDELRRIPLSPVIPIDFKLNEALMRLAPTLQHGDCWVASPAPLQQRSGVPSVRM